MRTPFINYLVLLAFLSVLLGSGISCAKSSRIDSLNTEMDKFIDPLDKADAPGFSIAIIQNGKIIFQRFVGLADVENNIPITRKTIFSLASMSKQFAAACIQLLSEQGSISLDDDIRNILPEMPDYGNVITIRHLLHHTSGIRDVLSLHSLAGVSQMNMVTGELISESKTTGEQVYRLITRQKHIEFQPGEKYEYSNSNYILLGLIVERISAMSLNDFAQKMFFKPLGMKNTYFKESMTADIKNLALGYRQNKEGQFYAESKLWKGYSAGAAGVYTTIDDLFKWDQNFYKSKIGGPQFNRLMTTQGVLNNGNKIEYASGLIVSELLGLKAVHHDGFGAGYRSAMLRHPDQEYTIIVLSNEATIDIWAFIVKATELYLSDEIKKDEKKQESETSQIPEVNIDPDLYNDYAGDYQMDDGQVITIAREEDKLVVVPMGFEFIPVTETKFFIKEMGAYISFVRNENSEVSHHIVHVGDQNIIVKKVVPTLPSPEQLKKYVGKYYSDELDVIYTATVQDDQLFVQIADLPSQKMKPVHQDEFTALEWNITFKYDDQNHIIGFRLDTNWIKNLMFDKK